VVNWRFALLYHSGAKLGRFCRHCEGNPLSLFAFAFAREDEVEVIRIRATPCTITCDVSGFWGETTPT